jgi:hypothetical protein
LQSERDARDGLTGNQSAANLNGADGLPMATDDDVFRALADPIRRQLLDRLLARNVRSTTA